MTDQELKKLNRAQLMNILAEQSKQIDEQKIKLEELEAKIAELEKAKKDQDMQVLECGSIAEAAIAVNGVFETAQKAADVYLENVKAKMENLDADLAAREAKVEAELKEKTDRINKELQKNKEDADNYSLKRRAEADDYYNNTVYNAKVEAEKKWTDLSGRLENFYQTHEGLKEMLSSMGLTK